MNKFFDYIKGFFVTNEQPSFISSMHNEQDMKDGLPLVNTEILNVTKMKIFSIHGKSDYKIGDFIEVNISTKEAQHGFKLTKYLEQKGVAILKRGGEIIKVKEL